jgi:hypothetical protein
MPQTTINVSDGGGNAILERHPDRCPICHSRIAPLIKYSKLGGTIYDAGLEVLYLCSNLDCNEFFLAYFEKASPTVARKLVKMRPIEPAPLTFEESIKQISANFCSIYEEAHKAEDFGLTEICGVGYRKALEFLIKDYLITKQAADRATVERVMLGPCIENYVTDPRIKDVAKRATWLGNDETHYQRRWIDKDLGDLKTLIRLVMHWIEAEYLTEEALKSMPLPSNP